MAKMTVGPGGIETISGAIRKPKKQNGHKCGNYVVATHRKAPTTSIDGCQRFYVKPSDAYQRSTPVSTHETRIRNRFAAVRAAVAARAKDLMKISADQAAFAAQRDLPNGKTTMNAYLWKVCGEEYDAEHNG